MDHGRDDRDQIGLAEVARPDILLAGGRLLREVEPYGPRRDVGIEPALGDLLLKAIDVKLPHPRGEGFPAARDLGLGLGDLLFYVVAKAPARLADLFSGDIGVIVVIAPVGLASAPSRKSV